MLKVTLITLLTIAAQAHAQSNVPTSNVEHPDDDMSKSGTWLDKFVEKLGNKLVNRLVNVAMDVSMIPNADRVLGLPEEDSSLVPHPNFSHQIQQELKAGIPLDKIEHDHNLSRALHLRGGLDKKAEKKMKQINIKKKMKRKAEKDFEKGKAPNPYSKGEMAKQISRR